MAIASVRVEESILPKSSMGVEASMFLAVSNRANKRRIRSIRWTKSEDEHIRAAVKRSLVLNVPVNWNGLVTALGGRRNEDELRTRWEKTLQDGTLVKGLWTDLEDKTIKDCIENGVTTWAEIAATVGSRTEKQCRER